MSKCANPDCKHPEATEHPAKGLCWPCYQSQRRAAMPKKKVNPCIEGRRYHSYNEVDKCRHCGAKRVFDN